MRNRVSTKIHVRTKTESVSDLLFQAGGPLLSHDYVTKSVSERVILTLDGKSRTPLILGHSSGWGNLREH